MLRGWSPGPGLGSEYRACLIDAWSKNALDLCCCAAEQGVTSCAARGVDRDEWRRHHQAGLTGFNPRELIASAHSERIMQRGMALGWNPSAAGFKVEDTTLATHGGAEIRGDETAWPTIIVSAAIDPSSSNSIERRPKDTMIEAQHLINGVWDSTSDTRDLPDPADESTVSRVAWGSARVPGRRAEMFSDGLAEDAVGINDPLLSVAFGPWGGTKQSGRRREKSSAGMEEVPEPCYVAWRA